MLLLFGRLPASVWHWLVCWPTQRGCPARLEHLPRRGLGCQTRNGLEGLSQRMPITGHCGANQRESKTRGEVRVQNRRSIPSPRTCLRRSLQRTVRVHDLALHGAVGVGIQAERVCLVLPGVCTCSRSEGGSYICGWVGWLSIHWVCASCTSFGGGGVWHKASVFGCLPLAAPIGLSPLLILTLPGPERVLVVSTEPPDDLSCLTTPGVGRPGDGLLPVPLTWCIQMHTTSPCGGLPTPALGCARWGVQLQDNGGGGLKCCFKTFT